MTRKKTSLRKYVRRANSNTKAKECEELIDQKTDQKRSLKLRSPMKSPYRQLKSDSPAIKRFKPNFVSPSKSPFNRHGAKHTDIKKLTPTWKSPLKYCPKSASFRVKKFKYARKLFRQATPQKLATEDLPYPNITLREANRVSKRPTTTKDWSNSISSDTLSAGEWSGDDLPLEFLPNDPELVDEFTDTELDLPNNEKAPNVNHCRNDINILSHNKRDTVAENAKLNLCPDTSMRQLKNENSSKINPNTQTIIDLVPNVLDTLAKHDGLDVTFVKFFELVSQGKFPLDNIAFLLWIEVVKWFSCTSTTEMRYSDKTKVFWKLGWRIFGGRFVNFMGGYKSHGEKVLKMTDPGKFSPNDSVINFAVPDVLVLREHDPYAIEIERKPGIYDDTLSKLSVALQHKSACITFDGKKLKQGLTEDSGDVDLLGFEKGETLDERKRLFKIELAEIDETMKTIVDALQSTSSETDTDELEDPVLNSKIKSLLLKCLTNLSLNINDIEKVRARKLYCKHKLLENSGQDWRKGKYVYAISAIKAYIHEIDGFVAKANSAINELCSYIAYLNAEKFVDDTMVNLQSHERYMDIDDLQNIDSHSTNTRLIKQRSDQWFQLRRQVKVTGSTLYQAIGCDSLARQKDHFEKVICGVPEKEPTPETRAIMTHGTVNEINAIATVVGKVLPVIAPKLIFCEEGCLTLPFEHDDMFMVVYPDGSLRYSSDMTTTEIAIEIKCPSKCVHTEFPPRYYLQCQAEIISLDVKNLLFVSWTETETTVFNINRDDEVFQEAMKCAFETYGVTNPKKPSRLTQECKNLKKEIILKSKQVEMVSRFASCKSKDVINNFSDSNKTNEELLSLLTVIRQCYKERYELLRTKATEAVVFLLADLDRSWQRNKIRCSPISWFPKGYSLDCETMRKIAEEVHTRCTNKGIHVPCQSFDGQWHPLVVRSASGEPLTTLQLQKYVWKNVEKMSKKEIVSELTHMNTNVIVLQIEKTNQGSENTTRSIEMTNGCIRLPVYLKDVRKEYRTKPSDCEELVCETTLADTVSDIVRAATDISEEILSMTGITDRIELEAFASNTNEEAWCRELESVQENVDEISERIETLHQRSESLPSKSTLSLDDMSCLIALLRTSKDCNKKGKWDSVDEKQLYQNFSSFKQLNRFLVCELRVIVRYLKKTKGMTGINESQTKRVKLNGIAKFLGLELDTINVTERNVRRHKIKSLKELCTQAVAKYSKYELNIILAEYRWPDSYAAWNEPMEHVTVNDDEVEWFYHPEFSTTRQQMEVKCIDSTHLLTRMRRKSSKCGIDNIRNDCWMKVAKQKKTFLTPIMVEEVTDPMSVSMAKTHFSEAVENEMRKNKDFAGANLCRDIRNWWESEDNPGIGAAQRIQMRRSLRSRLLSKVNFSRFPPATQYIAGWPLQLWEAVLASIDAKAYLYAIAHSGTYNVRAFSSLIGETFFAEVTLNDKTGQGTITAKEFGMFISRSTEQLQIRLDPERIFSYCTSKARVYDVVDEACEDEVDHNHCNICSVGTMVTPRCIVTRDHVFDMPQRKRLAGRKQSDHVSMGLNAVMKGQLGVRWEKARSNYAKMLPTMRMGISEDEEC